jgi:hypothetical protein
MDVLTWIIWRVVLDDPIHRWDIETSSRNISADQDTTSGVTKFEERIGSLVLLLTAL